MASILKVDQIQLTDGSTPTAGDLGIGENPKACFSMGMSGNISGSGSVWAKISSGLDTVAVDTDNAWNPSTHTYIIPRDGIYQMQVNHLSNGTNAHSSIYINGQGAAQSHCRQGETGYNATSGINIIRSLSQGDEIELYGYFDGGNYIYGGVYFCYTITQLN
jgi:hypothetical protein